MNEAINRHGHNSGQANKKQRHELGELEQKYGYDRQRNYGYCSYGRDPWYGRNRDRDYQRDRNNRRDRYGEYDRDYYRYRRDCDGYYIATTVTTEGGIAITVGTAIGKAGITMTTIATKSQQPLKRSTSSS